MRFETIALYAYIFSFDIQSNRSINNFPYNSSLSLNCTCIIIIILSII